MKKVISAREIEQILRGEGDVRKVPADALLTPSAREVLREFELERAKTQSGGSADEYEPMVVDNEFRWEPGSDPRPGAEIEAFFRSPAIEQAKASICEIGSRIWRKDYVDGNGGNMTVRVGDNLVLCTPTLISKGFMTPDDLCLVDMKGKQLAGRLKRTSEVLTHLGIMSRQPKAKSCVHAHPPHATAFAVASVKPPTCMIPESEVFLGEIGLARYQTPGSPENAAEVGEIGVDHQSIIMENHGVITWGKDVEDAYWKMENTDAYCKVIWIASQLGNGLHTFGQDKLRELIAVREQLGMPDKRSQWKECELCDNSEFRPGVVCQVVPSPAPSDTGPMTESLIQRITDKIMKGLGG